MINVGDGGQNFSILVDSIRLKTYTPGDLPLNSWTKVLKKENIKKYTNLIYFQISVDLSNLTSHFYSSLLFVDRSGMFKDPSTPNNTIFIDNVVMIPYNNSETRRQVVITDFCGATVRTPLFDVQENNGM